MDDDGDVGVVDVDLLVGEGLAEGRPHETVHVERVQLVGGRGAAGVDLEGLELPRLAEGRDGRGHVLALVEPALVRERDARHAGHAPDQGGKLLARATVLGLHDDVAGDPADVGDAPVAQGAMQVGDELVLERGAVLALETDLVVVDETEPLSHGAA